MSGIGEYLSNYRRSIVGREKDVFAEIVSAFRILEDRLETELKKLEADFDSVKEMPSAKLRRSKLLREILAKIERAITDYNAGIIPTIQREMDTAAQLGVDDARQAVQAALDSVRAAVGTGLPEFTLPFRAIENAAALMGDGSPLIQYFEETLTPTVVTAIREQVIEGVATGKPFAAIAKALRRAGDITRYRSLAVARTEVLRIRRESTLQVYRETDRIAEWEWVAVKSDRTCVLCLAMDGTRFPIDEAFPQHINCRCTMIAVMPGLPRIKRLLGRNWFKKQPGKVQKEILGPDGYAAWVDGQVRDLKDFVAFKNDAVFGTSIKRRPLAEVILKG